MAVISKLLGIDKDRPMLVKSALANVVDAPVLPAESSTIFLR